MVFRNILDKPLANPINYESKDLVRLLRCNATIFYNYDADDGALLKAAANEIERLRGDKEQLKSLWHLAEARIAEEREACALICDGVYGRDAITIAAAIRARGESNDSTS